MSTAHIIDIRGDMRGKNGPKMGVFGVFLGCFWGLCPHPY